MRKIFYQIRKCQREDCSLRYPVLIGDARSEDCPRCRGRTEIVLERGIEEEQKPAGVVGNEFQLEALLDNIRSAWNVGSMFRTADGMGMRGLYLCGITPTPENPRVAKTALGAEAAVPWTYHPDGVQLAETLKEKGASLWALEEGPKASALGFRRNPNVEKQVVLVVGNEIFGVDPGILELCERIFYIPMRGIKRSLNAAVAFGIAAHILLAQSD